MLNLVLHAGYDVRVVTSSDYKTSGSGLLYRDYEDGSGPQPEEGQQVSKALFSSASRIAYKGKLLKHCTELSCLETLSVSLPSKSEKASRLERHTQAFAKAWRSTLF